MMDLVLDAPGGEKSWAAFADTLGSEKGDQFKLKIAGWWMFPDDTGRAWEYLDHYLGGAGTPKEFELSQLLSEVPGIRTRFNNAIDEILRYEGVASLRKDFPIRQWDYERPGPDGALGDKVKPVDWLMALGSFSIEFTPVQPTRRTAAGITRLLRCWGSNLYRWHPDAKRVSQCVHQAGDRLQFTKAMAAAKPFMMIARPCLYELTWPSYGGGRPTGRVVYASMP